MKIYDWSFLKWLLMIVFLVAVFLVFIFLIKKNVLAPIIEVKSPQVDIQVTPQIKTLDPVRDREGSQRASISNGIDVNNIQYVKIAGKTLKVDLATTAKTQEQGLSGRKSLKENEGMLFVFDHMDKYSFWMKNMNFPIDIIWIGSASTQGGEDLHVVYIKKNTLPESYPETFTPNVDAKYVLEVNASFSEKNNLKVGDRVEFLPS